MNASEYAFTSDFWSGWIIVLTLGNILACWWLIRWTSKPRQGEAAAGETTGHKWDETLAEYNNPLPRWWLWLFYLTMLFGLAYLALYPGLGAWKGLLGWSQQGAYEQEMQAAKERFGPLFAKYAAVPVEQLARDPDALRIGERLFVNYCAGCHGSDAGGGPGFPNLRDPDWLYGGEPATIEASILDGRNGNMPAWGDILGEQGVKDVAAYVQKLAGREVDAARAAAGAQHFATYCAACHGADGKGNHTLGAPNLTDSVWLYGGSPGIIEKTIREGRSGRMPSHRDFLGEDKAHLLATYVYSLSSE
ncbi:MAG TPA: cytochrome-c oxidase, cbb3-type subunit III [Gammaproteobacteria bacterium]|nr:cytochrome-c oxidase, cbb3-type subunit III [Gammaproteobacteria bacterium]